MKLFTESKQFWRSPNLYWKKSLDNREGIEAKLAKYITDNEAIAGSPDKIIDAIDEYCKKTWMMNLGDEKGAIVDHYLKGR